MSEDQAFPEPQHSGHQVPASFGSVAPGTLPPSMQHTQPTLPLGQAQVSGTPVAFAAAPTAKLGAGKVTALVLAAALVGAGAGLGGGFLGASLVQTPVLGAESGPSSVTINNPDEIDEATAIAAKALPSVVTLNVASSAGSGGGSGVIISEDGYVLTNTHVVTLGGAASDPTIRVTASDGRLYNASIVGTDPLYDLAVIKLEGAEGLVPIEWEDSSTINVGSTAAAVGAPLGLSNSVTTGIVSALNRSISIASSAVPDDGADDDADVDGGPFQFDFPGIQPQTSGETISIAVIQTDAAINPGNSGGALVDGEGQLIGINVAIATSRGSSTDAGNIGVGFAIPSNIAKRIADELIENGSATHGLLGASVMTATMIEDATVAGAYIDEVTPGGAAQGAGLRAGDIVTRFNGVPISTARDLTAQVRAVAAGSDAVVTYVRDGKTYEVEVTLGSLVTA